MSAASFADWLNTIQNTPNTPPKQQGQVENAKTRAASANDPQGFDPGESALMMVAMRFADHIKASPQAREDWRRDVLETPQHLRQGLGEYLRQQLRQPHLLWRNQK